MKIRLLAAAILALALLLVAVNAVGVLAEDGVVYDHFLFLPLIMRPLPPADLSVSISSTPLPYTAGSPITYTVAVGNAGSAPLTALSLDLDIPKVITGTTFTPTVGTYNVLSGTWEGFTLTAGQEVTLQIVGSVSSTFTGTLWTTATVAPVAARDPDLTDNGMVDVNPLPLKNPGFEEEHWNETHYGTKPNRPIPEEWIAWWTLDEELGEPERMELIDWRDNPAFIGPPARMHTGYRSFMMYRWGKYEGGAYQHITGLPPGTVASFSIYAHAWACNEDPPPALSCGDPYAFWFRVGIDPTGGTDPWAESILWSDNHYIYDSYERVGPVESVIGEGGTITVFFSGQGKWSLKHNDAYWDDAALVIRPAAP